MRPLLRYSNQLEQYSLSVPVGVGGDLHPAAELVALHLAVGRLLAQVVARVGAHLYTMAFI